ncbi:putative inorganic phosphate cotransporter [Sitophilus oryzae]|uniref:Putative inorganic phosphate cotransporter n=1 Tax=Sitophilus oryzae TaxID=7048 RepID=A0A6J2YG52_SITOR|nr:putative inorganic phosphate cotransporter [Sitophilus oryzae]
MTNDTREKYNYAAITKEYIEKYEQKEEFQEDFSNAAPTIGYRHMQVLMYFFLCIVAYGFRVTISVGIVAMTDPTASSNPDIPTYPEWKDKNLILSAFFWGYVIPQTFAGWAANRFGAKWFLVVTMLVQSVLGTLIPLTAAQFGSRGVMISRAVQGLCQGFIYPSLTHLLSQWAPSEERSRLGTVVFAAGPCGTVIAILVTGLISASWYGWPLAFYLYGGLGLLWCIGMVLLGYDKPSYHPKISHSEKMYIEQSLGHTEEKATHSTPWRSIFTSVPVYALVATQIGFNYCFWTMLTQIPTYMNFVMNFNIKQNSLLSSLPYLTLWLLSFVMGFLSDAMINKGILSRTITRKIFNSIGLFIPAAALIVLSYTQPDEYVRGVVLLVIAVGFSSACFSGWAVNPMDLSPNHAGTLMGLTNGFAQCTGAIAPIVIQFLVTEERNPLQWRTVFLITAFLNISTGIIFDIFGSGKVQSWNDEEREDKEKS